MSPGIGVGVGLPFVHLQRRGGFSPASLFSSGEEGAWYDPSDLSTLWQDAAGTTPVTAADQPVGRIDDKSGNGNHATQSTAGSRPLYKTAGGLHWLEFDAVDDFLSTPDVDFSGGDIASVFLTIRTDPTDGVTQEIVTLGNNWISGSGRWVMRAPESGLHTNAGSRGDAAVNANQSAGTSSATYSGVKDLVVTARHDISNDLTTLRLNGADISSATGEKGAGNFDNTPIYIGRRGIGSFAFGGRIYGVIIVDTYSGSPQQVESYLAEKSGVTL